MANLKSEVIPKKNNNNFIKYMASGQRRDTWTSAEAAAEDIFFRVREWLSFDLNHQEKTFHNLVLKAKACPPLDSLLHFH